MRHTGLSSLPVELICHTFAYLDVRDLLHCTVVSKHIRRSILGSSHLQYAIELYFYRMVSTTPTSLGPPLATRLRILRERERAWKFLKWRNRHTLQLPPTGSVYEFVGGFYGNGREDDSRVTSSISLFQLPSAGVGPDLPHMWSHDLQGVMIIDFTMDPSQDLLILVALAPVDSVYVYELYLRTLSTNTPHPKASVPKLASVRRGNTINLNGGEVSAAVRIQVAGNLVALLVKEIVDVAGAHLEIWNWLCGPQFSCSMSHTSGIDDFCFLTDDTFLLVKPSGKFEVCTFLDPSKTSSKPALRAAYLFPPLAPGHVYWYISMSSNPAAGHIPHVHEPPVFPLQSGTTNDPKAEHCCSTKIEVPMYYPRPDERIHACCLYVFNPNPSRHEEARIHSFVFFVNIKTFLQNTDAPDNSPSVTDPSSGAASSPFLSTPLAPEHALFPSSSAVTASSPLRVFNSLKYPSDIPWEIWGPKNTRWFPERLSTDWQHALYGYRTIESVPPGSSLPQSVGEESAAEEVPEEEEDPWVSPRGGRRKLRLRDFNPYSIKYPDHASETAAEEGQWKGKVVTGPSTLRSGKVFLQDVISYLPYTEVITEETFDVTDVMLDDCRILLLKRAPQGSLSGIDVLTI